MKIGKFIIVCSLVLFSSFSFGQANVNFTSSDLPIIVINTNGGTIVDDPKITASMGIIYNGVGVRNNVNDPFNNFNGKIGIEIRGSTSQDFPKKQYGIEIQDAAGEGMDASLLGLPKKDDWVLFAPYNDKSLMRDALAYSLGRDLGHYASRARFCELIINNKYQGIYVLLEKVKRDKNRVNIDKLDPNENSGSDITGGYIIKLDKTTGSGGGAGWTSQFPPLLRSGNQATYFQYEYPKPEDISNEQKLYIKNYVDAFETALKGSNFIDPNNGYRKFIDVGSFVDYFIANEITRNPDAYRLSTFLHKKKDSDGDKLFMGPIWDFNLAYGNVNYCISGKPEGWVIDYNSVCPSDGWLIPFWWSRLFADETFRSQVVSRWRSLRDGAYKTSKVMARIDSIASLLNESQVRNFQAWPVLGQYVWPNYYVGNTYQAEVAYLKDWLSKRLVWMDSNIASIVTATENPSSTRLYAIAYPNPFRDKIHIEYESENSAPVVIRVLDGTGKMIVSRSLNDIRRGKNDLEIEDIHHPGIYLIKVQQGSESSLLKVIKVQ